MLSRIQQLLRLELSASMDGCELIFDLSMHVHVSFPSVKQVCVEHKNLKVAFSLLSEMKRYQIKPNLVRSVNL